MTAPSCSCVTLQPSKTTVPPISTAGNFGRDIRIIRPKPVFLAISVSTGCCFFNSATAVLILSHRPPAGPLKYSSISMTVLLSSISE